MFAPCTACMRSESPLRQRFTRRTDTMVAGTDAP